MAARTRRIDFAWAGNRIRGFKSSVPFVVVKALTID